MTIMESLSELRGRIEDLQKNLADKVSEFSKDERVPAEHRAKVDAMQAQAEAVREKLPAEENSVWDAIKHEVQRDMDALAQDFDHTVSYIDKHYREQK
jgi:predicted  nucleic acid-binding Zn-ribbon protein